MARLKTNGRLNQMAWPHVDRIANKAEPEDRFHTVEFEYAADSWGHARRVVLVIDELPSELYPHYFFLVTNATLEEASGDELVKRYRQRGNTEKEYGEWLNALDLSLSSTNRPKGNYRGSPPEHRSEPVDSFAVNEALMLTSLLGANLLHAARVLLAGIHGRLWSRESFRQHVLKAAARVARSSRYVTLWIAEKHAEHWQRIAHTLETLPRSRGSPPLQALPSSA
jgi:hypothetical protein